MPQDLRRIRDFKGLSVNQLASKSGISIVTLVQYERGKRKIPARDLRRLAKALYVEEWDINRQSTPPPAPPSTPSSTAIRGERAETLVPPKEEPVRLPAKDSIPPKPTLAQDSQIALVLSLAARLNMDQAALEGEVGKPLDKLTVQEGRLWHSNLTVRVAQEHPPQGAVDRKRAYLPEGVDGFELAYLQEKQEAGVVLHFTLFNGHTFTGRVIGFSPYQITICEPGGDEVTLNKLAIAYYRISGGRA